MSKDITARFKFYTDNSHIVIAICSYGGKYVRGIAKCSPSDKFNFEDGKDIARARCEAKIADKRLKKAKQRYDEAAAALNKSTAEFDKTVKSLLKAQAIYDSLIYNEKKV